MILLIAFTIVQYLGSRGCGICGSRNTCSFVLHDYTRASVNDLNFVIDGSKAKSKTNIRDLQEMSAYEDIY